MLLVIVGAGASYDSAIPNPTGARGPQDTNRPPLANELFEERGAFLTAFRNHSHFAPIIHRLRSLNGRGVEEVLEDLSIEGETYSHRKVQLLAVRYYLKAAVQQCTFQWLNDVEHSTNYRVLIDLIRQYRQFTSTPVLFVTFNYDRMLEDALHLELGHQFLSINSYARAGQDFSLFKMHGSTNWARFVKTRRTNYPGMIEIAESHGIDETDYIVLDDEVGKVETAYGFIPALAIPLQSKNTFECPQEHCQNLEQALSKVKKVLTIGWRGLEQHFLSMLNRFLIGVESLLVVSKGDGKAISDRLVSQLANRAFERADIQWFENGFSEFVDTPSVIQRFLKTPR
jgi:hypothetical protein